MNSTYPLTAAPWAMHPGFSKHRRLAKAMWAQMQAQDSGSQPSVAAPSDDDAPRGGRHGHHRHGGRRGPGGQGPWGGRGPWGPPRGRRRERGDVRAAVLLLLAEQPRHGYEILTELADRSDGQWQPSPGSVYPVLKRLAHEGLVEAQSLEGKRVFSLTQAGRDLVAAEGSGWGEPWAAMTEDAGADALWAEGKQLGGAVWQVAQLDDPEQVAAATAILVEARKRIYGLLAQ